MTGAQLQEWLNAHGASLVVDGQPGELTRAAIKAVFTNTCAPAVTSADIAALANRLGCTPKQLAAVAKVESAGGGYDDKGRPKILFERHKFYKFTNGRFGVTSFSNPKRGGYNESSWDKLAYGACKDPSAAFSSVSWGKFQVMGFHWSLLGYPSAIDMAYSTVTGEAAHYDMLGRFIEKNGLRAKLIRLSTNPVDCRPFAEAYNGTAYRENRYDEKLAEAMR
jgi:hypothetical protein